MVFLLGKNRRNGPVALLALIIFVVSLTLLGSKWFLRMVFPLHYRDVVAAKAVKYRVDPFLIIAMVRVESHFNPEARSEKGAVGLMQLMPETADWIYGQMERGNFDPALLHDPEINVELGVWYLRSLLDEFGADPVLALAAYNGGRGRVAEWLSKEQWTGQRDTLHQIPFPETRSYVERVLTVREWYRKLYGKF